MGPGFLVPTEAQASRKVYLLVLDGHCWVSQVAANLQSHTIGALIWVLIISIIIIIIITVINISLYYYYYYY